MYGDQPVFLGKNTTTKAMKLLQILLYHGEQGIAREKLLNTLYVREELADASNNLRVTVHRLKKIIIDAGLPADDYINIKKGIYSWHSPMKTVVDTKVFVSLYKEAKECTDAEQKEALRRFDAAMKGEKLDNGDGEEGSKKRKSFKEKIKEAFEE